MSSPRILLVEDEPVFAGAAAKVLSRAGYDVVTADSLEPAAAVLETGRFDAVITDLSLDGTRGQEGLQIARLAKRRNPGTAVILVTAYGNEDTSRRASASGVDLKLDKPVSLALLKQVLHDFGLAVSANHAMPPPDSSASREG